MKGLPVPPNGTVNKNQQGVAVPTPHTAPSEGLKGPWTPPGGDSPFFSGARVVPPETVPYSSSTTLLISEVLS